METSSGWLVERTALPFARLSCHPDGAWRGLIKWLFAVEIFDAVYVLFLLAPPLSCILSPSSVTPKSISPIRLEIHVHAVYLYQSGYNKIGRTAVRIDVFKIIRKSKLEN